MVPVPFLRLFPGLFALRGALGPSRRGKPQCGQEYALSDTFPEHSGHVVSAMLSISFHLPGRAWINRRYYLTQIEILTIIYLTRQPEDSSNLSAWRKYVLKIVVYFLRAGRLFFMLIIPMVDKGYNSHKHKHERNQITPSHVHVRHPLSCKTQDGMAIAPWLSR